MIDHYKIRQKAISNGHFDRIENLFISDYKSYYSYSSCIQEFRGDGTTQKQMIRALSCARTYCNSNVMYIIPSMNNSRYSMHQMMELVKLFDNNHFDLNALEIVFSNKINTIEFSNGSKIKFSSPSMPHEKFLGIRHQNHVEVDHFVYERNKFGSSRDISAMEEILITNLQEPLTSNLNCVDKQ